MGYLCQRKQRDGTPAERAGLNITSTAAPPGKVPGRQTMKAKRVLKDWEGAQRRAWGFREGWIAFGTVNWPRICAGTTP